MSSKKNKIQNLVEILFTRYVKGISGRDEKDFVDKIYDSIGNSKKETPQNLDIIKQEIKSAIDRRINKPKSFKLTTTWYYSISAAILLIFFGLGYLIIPNNESEDKLTKNEVPSGKIFIEKAPALIIDEKESYNINQEIPLGSKFEIIDNEKVLNLTTLDKEDRTKKIRIVNPSKIPISILLVDGSRVWLNFNSTLEFDFDIKEEQRLAVVTGEVFFDIQKLEQNGVKIPFVVKTQLQTIDVLGTKFNVNTTFSGEESVELIEGSIRLSNNLSGNKTILIPGQKAYLKNNSNQILVTNSENLEKAIAWRKGLFYFEGESLQTISNELSAWYEIPVIISPEIQRLKVSAMIKRFDDIDQVFELIELTNNVKSVKMKGKIYVNKK